MADPTLKAIFKYKHHPSILAIQSNCEKETFCFSDGNIEDIKKDIKIKIKIKPPSIQTFLLKLSKRIWTLLPTFYVQTLTALSNHLRSHLV